MPKIHELSKTMVEVSGVVNCRRVRQRFTLQRHGPEFRKIAEAKFNELVFDSAGLVGPEWSGKARNMRRLTVAQLGARYVAEHLSTTRAARNSSYVNLITHKWGAERLSQVAIERVRPWIYSMLNQPYKGRQYSPYSVKKVARYFQRLFNWGCEIGLIDSNPLRYLFDRALSKSFRRQLRPRKEVIPEQEWKGMTAGMPAWLRRAAAASWFTGMRLGEVVSVRWDQIQEDVIHFEPDATKETDHKNIVFPPELAAILDEIRAEQLIDDPDGIKARGHVFTSCAGRPFSATSLTKSWRWYCDKIGKKYRYHDLRRSWINRVEAQGKSLRAVMAQVGHHAATTTAIYRAIPLAEQRSLASAHPPVAKSGKPDQPPEPPSGTSP